MGFVIRRGTRDKPRYYIRYVDVDGGEKSRRVPAKTKAEAERFLHQAETRLMEGRLGMEPKTDAMMTDTLMDEWMMTLTNRDAAGDRGRVNKHVRPAFAGMPLSTLQEIGPVMAWLDGQRRAGDLSSGSIRHNLNLLSRFFSWAIERGYSKVNPVRMIPTGKRPQEAQKRDMPWLADDAQVVSLMNHLPEPINLMFYLGNRSGLRTGELAGLRMADMDYLKDGAIRIRYSYGGPLKEDKGQTGKMKWVPAPSDSDDFLGLWLKRRKLQGAKPEDLVFPAPPAPNSIRKRDWHGYRKEFIEDCWAAAKDAHNKKCEKEHHEDRKVDMTWYQATRHSFVTRNLEAGASLDEVSDAVGHSSPGVTRRFYDHHVRRSFSATLTARLGRPEKPAR